MTTKFELLTAMENLDKAMVHAWLGYAGYNVDEIYGAQTEINRLKSRVLNELPLTASSQDYNCVIQSCTNAETTANLWPRNTENFESLMIDTHIIINDVSNLLAGFGSNVSMANAYEHTQQFNKAAQIWQENLDLAQDEGDTEMIRISSMSLLRLHKRSKNIEGPSPQALHRTIAQAELKY